MVNIDNQVIKKRELQGRLLEVLKQLPVVVISGLRQTGKTTLLTNKPIGQGRRYLTLDDYSTLAAARQSPEQLIQGDDPITIDEVQRCPELLMAIKIAVDQDRTPGRFLLSGSANLALLSGVSESLAGRAVTLELGPFTWREISGTTDNTPYIVEFMQQAELPKIEEMGHYIDEAAVLAGGMPPTSTMDDATRETWFVGYEQTYLERDIRDLTQVADLISFRNLLRLSAMRTGQVLNQSDLARDAKLPAATVTRYINLLETSFIIERLPPYMRNRASRLIKSPKLYVTDSGLAAYLSEVDTITTDESLRGALFETYVHQNLKAIIAAHLPRASLHYWHIQGRHEVDFVLSYKRRCVAIELKAASRIRDRDLRGLKAFMDSTDNIHACILAYTGTTAVPLGDKLLAIPLSMLLA